jgi:hypothetical protein
VFAAAGRILNEPRRIGEYADAQYARLTYGVYARAFTGRGWLLCQSR